MALVLKVIQKEKGIAGPIVEGVRKGVEETRKGAEGMRKGVEGRQERMRGR